jgi:tetratricopeptide (TPR) repeat protein
LDAPITEIEKFPDLPPGTWPILRKCLAVRPEDRYISADEISKECKALLKSIAEDVDLMRSELYSSISPLRKAARHVDAPPGLIRLLEETEKLLKGNEADYATLDRLTTSLLEHYPDIQAAAGEATPPNPVPLAPKSSASSPVNNGLSKKESIILPPPPVFAFLNEQFEDESDSEGINPIERLSNMGMESQKINFALAQAPKRKLLLNKKLWIVLLLIAAAALAGFLLARIRMGPKGLSVDIHQVSSKLSGAFSAVETERPDSGIGANIQREPDQSSTESMLKKARVLMNENRLEDSKIILRKILEADPAYEPAHAALNELIALSNVDKTGKDGEALRNGIRKISALLNADNLQAAQVEMEKLQKEYPESTALYPLKKRWHEKASEK